MFRLFNGKNDEMNLAKGMGNYTVMSRHELLDEAKEMPNPRVMLALSHVSYPSNKINSYMIHSLLFCGMDDLFVSEKKEKIFSMHPQLKDHIIHLKNIVDVNDFEQTQKILCCYIKFIELLNYVSSLNYVPNLDKKNNHLNHFIHQNFIPLISNLLSKKPGESPCWTTANGSSHITCQREIFDVKSLMTYHELPVMLHEEYSKYLKDIVYVSHKRYGEISLTKAAIAFSSFLISEAKLNTFVSSIAHNHYYEFTDLEEKYCKKTEKEDEIKSIQDRSHACVLPFLKNPKSPRSSGIKEERLEFNYHF